MEKKFQFLVLGSAIYKKDQISKSFGLKIVLCCGSGTFWFRIRDGKILIREKHSGSSTLAKIMRIRIL